MSAESTGAILVGNDRQDVWGSLERRPSHTIFLIHYGAPVLARESATFPANPEDASATDFPATMVCRPDPVDFAYDLAYYIALQTAGTVADDAELPAELKNWPKDSRDDNAFERRTALHESVATAVAQLGRKRLELVRFEQDALLGPECVATLRKLGYVVEVFERVQE